MAKILTSSKKKLAALKTKENNVNVISFLSSFDEQKKEDGLSLLKMMELVTKTKPKMWGGTIIGFGKYIYTSPKTGRSGEWFMAGFSPRKQNMTIYFMTGLSNYSELLKKLGKHKVSEGSCLYINKLADIDLKVLKNLVVSNWKYMKEKYSKQ